MNGSKKTTHLIRTTLDWLHSTAIKIVYHDPFCILYDQWSDSREKKIIMLNCQLIILAPKLVMFFNVFTGKWNKIVQCMIK